MLTDLAWARAARAAAGRPLARAPPRAVIYSSTTAALLWPRPGAIRFDAPSRGNRPGRHGLWQRPLERRRLAQAPLLLPLSEQAMQEAPPSPRQAARTLVIPIPVAASGPPEAERDITAITYGANPSRRASTGCWRPGGACAARGTRGRGELVIAGAEQGELTGAGISVPGEAGVRVVGRLAPAEYRALLRRARVFVCAPRREDYGTAQLEALADGCMLVTTPSPGPYAALRPARELDGRLVGEDLAAPCERPWSSPRPATRPARRSSFSRSGPRRSTRLVGRAATAQASCLAPSAPASAGS